MVARLILVQSACRTQMQTPWRLTGSAIVFLGRRIACFSQEAMLLSVASNEAVLRHLDPQAMPRAAGQCL
jgi:hypothetical protein